MTHIERVMTLVQNIVKDIRQQKNDRKIPRAQIVPINLTLSSDNLKLLNLIDDSFSWIETYGKCKILQ